MRETELAKSVITWLEGNGWDVYQEVQPLRCDRVADIVAVSGPTLWIIECKTTLGLSVMAQALLWIGWAHYVSVAVPDARHSRGRSYAYGCLEQDTGLIEVYKEPVYTPEIKGPRGRQRFLREDWSGVAERVAPKLHRKHPSAAAARIARLRAELSPQHKTYAEAGNAGGRRWTPFRQTCERMRAAVANNPGMGTKELIANLRHHYMSAASARGTLSRLAQEGVIEGVRCVKEGSRLRFYPTTKGES